MIKASRRSVLSFGFAAGTLALAQGFSIFPAHSGPTGSVLPDPRTLIPPELLGPLDKYLASYGQDDFDAANLSTLRRIDASQIKPLRFRDVRRRLISSGSTDPDITVFLINASKRARLRPAILFIHGGDYVLGTAQEDVPDLERIAHELDCIVVAVDYRLAPETRFPGSLNDNYAALKWLWSSAESLGVDTNRIAIMGASAGGGHAAMLAVAVRDRKEFNLVAQILIYPMLDDRTGSTREVPKHIGTFLWTRKSNQFGWSSLLGQAAGAPSAPYGSVPSRIPDLSGLPPTFIGVGSIDLFISENIDYASRLVSAGTSVELLVVPGAYHGFDLIAPSSPLSRRFREAKFAALRRAFSPRG